MKNGTSIKKVDRNQYRMSHLGASSPQADDRELAAFALIRATPQERELPSFASCATSFSARGTTEFLPPLVVGVKA